MNVREFECVREWLGERLKLPNWAHYPRELKNFCEFVGKNPDEILAERKKDFKEEDLKAQRRYEHLVKRFYEERRKEVSSNTAITAVAIVRSFFRDNYMEMKFRRWDFGPRITTHLDYVPTWEDIARMCEVASVRDRALILTSWQTGFREGDLVRLRREQVEGKIAEGKYPFTLGWIPTQKEGVLAHPFIGQDAGEAIKLYLQRRGDDKPWLFMDKYGGCLKGRYVNEVVKNTARWAKIDTHGGRIRAHCLRKACQTALQEAGVPVPWIYLMVGHKLPGSEGAYTRPSETQLFDVFKRAEPLISIRKVQPVLTTEEIEKLVEKRANTLVDTRMKELKTSMLISRTHTDELMDRFLDDPENRELFKQKLKKMRMLGQI